MNEIYLSIRNVYSLRPETLVMYEINPEIKVRFYRYLFRRKKAWTLEQYQNFEWTNTVNYTYICTLSSFLASEKTHIYFKWAFNWMFQLSCVLLSFLDHIVSFPNKWQIVPQSDEREPKKKTKSSSKVSDQGNEWVDQLLCLDCCLPRDCPPIKNIIKDVKKTKT